MGMAVVLDTVTATAPLTVVGDDVAVGDAVALLLDGAGVGVGLALVGFGEGLALVGFGEADVGFGLALFDCLLALALVASEELLPEHAASESAAAAAMDTMIIERRTRVLQGVEFDQATS